MTSLSTRTLGLVLLVLACLGAGPALAQKAPPAKKRPALGFGAAFAPDGALWITALDAQGRLFVQRSADDGKTWGEPRVLDTQGDVVAADGESRPKLAFGPDGVAVISYTRPLAKPFTGEIRMLRSGDGGQHFGAPFTVHQDRQVITHRFDSIAFDARGVLHTVWVDKRDLEASKAGTTGARGGAAPYRGAAIYHNASIDGGRSFGPDLLLAHHSCECCRIALTPTPEGGMAAMWRHVFEPNERDHAFARLPSAAASTPATTEPARASLDHWAIDGCPHHGPGLAPAAGGGYHAVWFGQRQGQPAVRYGRLDAEGRALGEVTPLPDAAAEHADIASSGAQVAIVWRSFDGQATRWRAWVSADDGRHFTLRELGRSALENDHPRLAQHGRTVLALWRDAEGVRVETLLP